MMGEWDKGMMASVMASAAGQSSPTATSLLANAVIASAAKQSRLLKRMKKLDWLVISRHGQAGMARLFQSKIR